MKESWSRLGDLNYGREDAGRMMVMQVLFMYFFLIIMLSHISIFKCIIHRN